MGLSQRATEDVLGKNGLRALLNYGGMSYLIENKPDYSLEKNFTDDDFTALSTNYYKLLGASGAKAVFRLIGSTITKRVVRSGLLDSFTKLEGFDRLYKSLELYTIASGRGRVIRDANNIAFDVPQCTVCKDIREPAPYCTIYNGIIDELIRKSEVEGMRTVDTKCKALGDDTCYFEVLPAE